MTFFSEIMPFMRQCEKNIAPSGKPQMAIWRMRIACWIHKAAKTYSEHVILVYFSPQKWLYECA
jgi:hypothetical protein